jgi:serine/threonine protein kinase
MHDIIFRQRYRVTEKISQGAMGTVYAVCDLPSGKRLALKELKDSSTCDAEREMLEQQFLREADLLRTLSHQSIPELHDCFVENGKFCLVMDFIEGMTIEEHVLRHGTPGLPEGHVLAIALELCETLSYLHSQVPPVIFRDLKPSNIMLTRQNTIMLIDFGIAQALAGSLRGTSVGTEGYAPPEQYRGLVDERSDIYSLGATLHHLVSGRNPRMHEPFAFPPLSTLAIEITPAFQSIISRALQHEPAMRFASADDMKALLLEAGCHERTGSSLGDGEVEKSDYRIERSLPLIDGGAEAASGHLALARKLLKGNRLLESLEELREAVRNDPELFEAHREMGLVLLRLEMYQDALQQLMRAQRLNAWDCETSFFLGAALLALRREEEAMASFARSSALNLKRTEELLGNHTNYTLCTACMSIYSRELERCPACRTEKTPHAAI